MSARSSKEWCDECKLMRFAGDCGHRRTFRPPVDAAIAARHRELWTMRGELRFALPLPKHWPTYDADADGRAIENEVA